MASQVLKLVLCVGICLGVGALGSLFATGTDLSHWYVQLNKPSFNPPNWVFGPVWTVLYVLMGVAAFLVWRRGLGRRDVRLGLWLFAVQLGLNFVWTPLFFGCHRIGTAFVDLVLLWLAILAVITTFHRVSMPAAICLYPYLGWVSFATSLNGSLWRLNP
jgi:tryptophan-rich sensory protein